MLVENETNPDPLVAELLPIAQVRKAWRCSEPTARMIRRRDNVPVVQIGRRLFITRADFDAHVARNRTVETGA